MTTWDEKAEAVAQALYPEDRQSHELRRLGATTGFMYGVGSALTWASNDEAIERAAEAIYRHQVPTNVGCFMTQWGEAHETQRDHFRAVARTALTAAIEGDE